MRSFETPSPLHGPLTSGCVVQTLPVFQPRHPCQSGWPRSVGALSRLATPLATATGKLSRPFLQQGVWPLVPPIAGLHGTRCHGLTWFFNPASPTALSASHVHGACPGAKQSASLASSRRGFGSGNRAGGLSCSPCFLMVRGLSWLPCEHPSTLWLGGWDRRVAVVERVSLWVFSGCLLTSLARTLVRRRLFRTWGLSLFYRPQSEAAYVLAAFYLSLAALAPARLLRPYVPTHARCTHALHALYTEASYRWAPFDALLRWWAVATLSLSHAE